jgi:hypothetical protein
MKKFLFLGLLFSSLHAMSPSPVSFVEPTGRVFPYKTDYGVVYMHEMRVVPVQQVASVQETKSTEHQSLWQQRCTAALNRLVGAVIWNEISVASEILEEYPMLANTRLNDGSLLIDIALKYKYYDMSKLLGHYMRLYENSENMRYGYQH